MDDESLIPSEDWLDHPDPAYDQPCPSCSALVENRAVHRAWHLAMVELANQYVPEPRYG